MSRACWAGPRPSDSSPAVSRSCACIGSPCLKPCVHDAPIQLRHCVPGASIGGGGGRGGGLASVRGRNSNGASTLRALGEVNVAGFLPLRLLAGLTEMCGVSTATCAVGACIDSSHRPTAAAADLSRGLHAGAALDPRPGPAGYHAAASKRAVDVGVARRRRRRRRRYGGGESFLRVHWVAVPKALRTRRVNNR
jgi:hypothetical protein